MEELSTIDEYSTRQLKISVQTVEEVQLLDEVPSTVKDEDLEQYLHENISCGDIRLPEDPVTYRSIHIAEWLEEDEHGVSETAGQEPADHVDQAVSDHDDGWPKARDARAAGDPG